MFKSMVMVLLLNEETVVHVYRMQTWSENEFKMADPDFH